MLTLCWNRLACFAARQKYFWGLRDERRSSGSNVKACRLRPGQAKLRTREKYAVFKSKVALPGKASFQRWLELQLQLSSILRSFPHSAVLATMLSPA